jgi:hypothetical protein
MKNIPLVDDSVEDIIRNRPFNLQGGYGFLFQSGMRIKDVEFNTRAKVSYMSVYL